MIGPLRRWLSRHEAALSEAGLRDVAALAALHAASFQRGWSEEEFEGLLVDRGVMVDRASFGRELAGFVISRRAADEAEILSVAVAARHRRRGLAGRLLRLHMGKLDLLGVRRVFLEVDEDNAAARRLYQQAGFRVVGRRAEYYQTLAGAGGVALVLRRDLA